ncbi:MAG: actin-binding WH2 domain-containing protein [Candidatus Riflebacteria bacterium]|nr:actin-binding WH2 domain-containing protein [Candidatus Riflebacteria bacterium]
MESNEVVTEKKEDRPLEDGNFNICPSCNAKVKKGTQICPTCQTFLFFDEVKPEKRFEKLQGFTFAELLLREKEYLFETIFQEKELNEKLKYYALYSLLFSALYGGCLGVFAGYHQIILGAIKVPLLIFGTLLICLPALYTFNIILGSKLSFKQIGVIVLISTFLLSIVLASLSPILLFFIFSTTSRSFIALLNIIIFTISGSFALSLLWKGMNYLTVRNGSELNTNILYVWSGTYMFVGCQLAWMLRPFIGQSGKIILFRAIEGNFYQGVFHIIRSFF